MDVNKKQLVFAIINFLNEEVSGPGSTLDSDGKESLEVAVQCLENVFGVSVNNPTDREQLYTSPSLLRLFSEHKNVCPPTEGKFGDVSEDANIVVSEEDKKAGDDLKNQGNDLMKVECFSDAIEKYSQAIQKNPRNAVYLSNRAAAYSKQGEHDKAIQDCLKALRIDPKYSKAYGRMGLAYTELKQYKEAINAYNSALELDPANESYQNNLSVAKDLDSKPAAGQGPAGPTLGGFDLGNLGGQAGGLGGIFNNPQFMNMASQLMSNPEVMNAFSSAMNQPGGGEGGAGGGPNMNSLMQMGQRLAEQIERDDPEKVAQLRDQFQRGGFEGGPGAGGNAS